MRFIKAFSFILLFSNLACCAQDKKNMVIYQKDGNKVSYLTENIDSITFIQGSEQEELTPELIKIYAEAPQIVYSKAGSYEAFCDVVKYRDKYYCVFREGENHAPYHEWHTNGYLRVLSSADLKDWKEELTIKDDAWDLRDPCFCKADAKLFLYYGFYSFEQPTPPEKTGWALLDDADGKLQVKDSGKLDIGSDSNHWLWKIYYDDGYFYGAAYHDKSSLKYVTSDDGIHFKKISDIVLQGDEASMEMLKNKNKVAVIRNVTAKGNALLAVSEPPYTEWNSIELNEMIESPESFIYNDDVYVIGRSRYGMSVFKIDLNSNKAIPVYNFFAYGGYGDCGYPGVLLDNKRLYVVYYAVNPQTDNTTIYQTNLFFGE